MTAEVPPIDRVPIPPSPTFRSLVTFKTPVAGTHVIGGREAGLQADGQLPAGIDRSAGLGERALALAADEHVHFGVAVRGVARDRADIECSGGHCVGGGASDDLRDAQAVGLGGGRRLGDRKSIPPLWTTLPVPAAVLPPMPRTGFASPPAVIAEVTLMVPPESTSLPGAPPLPPIKDWAVPTLLLSVPPEMVRVLKGAALEPALPTTRAPLTVSGTAGLNIEVSGRVRRCRPRDWPVGRSRRCSRLPSSRC